MQVDNLTVFRTKYKLGLGNYDNILLQWIFLNGAEARALGDAPNIKYVGTSSYCLCPRSYGGNKPISYLNEVCRGEHVIFYHVSLDGNRDSSRLLPHTYARGTAASKPTLHEQKSHTLANG